MLTTYYLTPTDINICGEIGGTIDQYHLEMRAMNETSLTMKCADFINNLDYRRLPSEAIEMAKDCFIDFLGCVISGSVTPEAKIILDFAAGNPGLSEATVLGVWRKDSLLNAAMANAFNCHIHEMDDVHKASVQHPGAPVISSALAVGEAYGKSGKELIEAIVAGYDVVLRVGEAVMPSHYSFWHTTGTCGTFGATASAGKLMGLTPDELTNALGNAGSQATGLWQFIEDNAMTKYLHCGKAAYNGALAAILARRGLTGAKRILEGEQGFVKATSTETNPAEKFSSLGSKYKILETSFKPFASCRHTHPTISAILNLRKKYNLSTAEVSKVKIKTYQTATEIARNNKYYPDSRAAKFSLVYCAAAALYFGALPLQAFTPEALQNEKILRVAKNTVINVDEEINRAFPGKWMTRVELHTKDRCFTETVEYPLGDPENPMTERNIYDKFMDLVMPVIGKEKADSIYQKCRELEQTSDIAKFFMEVIQQ